MSDPALPPREPPWHPPWPGISARGTVILPLPASAFPDVAGPLSCAGVELQPKSEFHVTVLDRDLASRLRDYTPRKDEPDASPAALFAGFDWRWARTGERWLLHKPTGAGGHSLVELLSMPALQQFRLALGPLLRLELPRMPAHVTLYTAGSAVGIGLPDEDSFRRLRVARCPDP